MDVTGAPLPGEEEFGIAAEGDLRHSYATAALAAGASPKVVSERLGHATISITLDVL